MTTVAILGAGEIAGATAHTLASRGRVDRILLIDGVGGAASGKALDIYQSGAVDWFQTRLDGTDDVSRVAGCAVCVIADRFGVAVSEWNDDEGLAVVGRVASWLGDAPLVFAGPQQSELIGRSAREARIQRDRLIGSSPEALRSALTAIVAVEARCSPREVALTVLGIPPAGAVVPWSEASIGGYALERVVSQVQLRRIESRAMHLWPPGPFASGCAAAVVTEALLSSGLRSYSVLTQLDGEFGVRNRPGILPARLGPPGIVQIRVPELNTRERVQLQTALGG
jgi:malate dehydrogenase